MKRTSNKTVAEFSTPVTSPPPIVLTMDHPDDALPHIHLYDEMFLMDQPEGVLNFYARITKKCQCLTYRIRKGQPVAVNFEGKWQRGEIWKTSKEKIVLVHLVTSGLIRRMNIGQIKYLLKEFDDAWDMSNEIQFALEKAKIYEEYLKDVQKKKFQK